ncbi:pantoate kinase [Methanococcoides burtonii]|uniref:Pantoate kinase n=1 Tax=Methanococcoides burtonii (strain DSM 6242 / NBRC 107633 / OCM 468 / ACE-M) TaxID=259564 RepID=Q12WR7_METBU|nr:pantoate kinase [Methanococcoides burtonii]ABE52109.1 diphosphomevalonate decarboxylase [Methanococcoides burtonii DSM 6242]
MSTKGHVGRAFAPGHITGFFEIHDDPLPQKRGSTGCGLVLDGGIETTVSESMGRTEIILDGIPVLAETTRAVVDKLVDFPVRVSCTSSIPIGCGFGASAAGALSVAYALNEAFSLDLTSNQLLETAHIAEVTNGSGMGDVEGQSQGGIPIRLSAGCPPYGKLDRVPSPPFEIFCVVLGELSTGSILEDSAIMREINSAGREALHSLLSRPTLENFMQLSKQFTLRCGLASEHLLDAIESVNAIGGMSSQAMLGDTIFAISGAASKMDIMLSLKEFGDVLTYNVGSCNLLPLDV